MPSLPMVCCKPRANATRRLLITEKARSPCRVVQRQREDVFDTRWRYWHRGMGRCDMGCNEGRNRPLHAARTKPFTGSSPAIISGVWSHLPGLVKACVVAMVRAAVPR